MIPTHGVVPTGPDLLRFPRYRERHTLFTLWVLHRGYWRTKVWQVRIVPL